MKAQPKKNRRVSIEVSEGTLEAIDDYRFTTRAPNRSEAARRQIKAGQVT